MVCAYDAGNYTCQYPAAHLADCGATANVCVGGDYCRYDPTVPGYRCWTIPTSPQGIGGDCYYRGREDCQAGLFCDGSQNNTCQPLLPSGASCTSESQCGPNSTCSRLGSEPTGLCVTLKTSGTQCRAGAGECFEGLSCIGPSVGSPGVCRPYGTTGAICGNPYYFSGSNNEYVDCAVGYFCNNGSGLTGTCAPNVPLGGSCLIGGVTQYGACGGFFTGYYCDTTIPAAPVCSTNTCNQMLGWFPSAG